MIKLDLTSKYTDGSRKRSGPCLEWAQKGLFVWSHLDGMTLQLGLESAEDGPGRVHKTVSFPSLAVDAGC